MTAKPKPRKLTPRHRRLRRALARAAAEKRDHRKAADPSGVRMLSAEGVAAATLNATTGDVIRAWRRGELRADVVVGGAPRLGFDNASLRAWLLRRGVDLDTVARVGREDLPWGAPSPPPNEEAARARGAREKRRATENYIPNPVRVAAGKLGWKRRCAQAAAASRTEEKQQ